MADRHKQSPMSLRLPEVLAAWVAKRAAATGKTPHRVVVEAVEQVASGITAPVAAKTPKPSAGRKAAGQSGTEEKTRHRCPVKGWCSVCSEMKGVKR